MLDANPKTTFVTNDQNVIAGLETSATSVLGSVENVVGILLWLQGFHQAPHRAACRCWSTCGFHSEKNNVNFFYLLASRLVCLCLLARYLKNIKHIG